MSQITDSQKVYRNVKIIRSRFHRRCLTPSEGSLTEEKEFVESDDLHKYLEQCVELMNCQKRSLEENGKLCLNAADADNSKLRADIKGVNTGFPRRYWYPRVEYNTIRKQKENPNQSNYSEKQSAEIMTGQERSSLDIHEGQNANHSLNAINNVDLTADFKEVNSGFPRRYLYPRVGYNNPTKDKECRDRISEDSEKQGAELMCGQEKTSLNIPKERNDEHCIIDSPNLADTGDESRTNIEKINTKDECLINEDDNIERASLQFIGLSIDSYDSDIVLQNKKLKLQVDDLKKQLSATQLNMEHERLKFHQRNMFMKSRISILEGMLASSNAKEKFLEFQLAGAGATNAILCNVINVMEGKLREAITSHKKCKQASLKLV